MKKYIVQFHLNRDKWSEIVETNDPETAKETARQWLLNRIDNDPKSLITLTNVHEIKTYGDLMENDNELIVDDSFLEKPNE